MAITNVVVNGPFQSGQRYRYELEFDVGGGTAVYSSTDIPGEVVHVAPQIGGSVQAALTSNYPKPSTIAFSGLANGHYSFDVFSQG